MKLIKFFFFFYIIISPSLADETFSKDSACKDVSVYIPFIVKYAYNAINSSNIQTCNYYASGALKYSKYMSKQSNICGCGDYDAVKVYITAEKAYLHKDLNKCITLSQEVITLTSKVKNIINKCEYKL